MSAPELHYISFPTKDATGKDTGVMQFAVLLTDPVTSADGVAGRRAVINPALGTFFSTATLEAESRKQAPSMWAMIDQLAKPGEGK